MFPKNPTQKEKEQLRQAARIGFALGALILGLVVLYFRIRLDGWTAIMILTLCGGGGYMLRAFAIDYSKSPADTQPPSP